MQFYAKRYGDSFETLEEHTKNLLKEYERLKTIYKDKINVSEYVWEALKYACLLHDIGKISNDFQNKILKNKKSTNEIPHNFLSGIFLYNDNVIEQFKNADDLFLYVLYAILFHHDRKFNITEEQMYEVFEKDFKNKIKHLNWIGIDFSNIESKVPKIVFYKIKDFKVNYDNYLKKFMKNEKYNYKHYIFIKGMLHKIDHSASAHIEVEQPKIENPNTKIINYLKSKNNFTDFRDFQKKAIQLKSKNVLLQASTGLGKTEFALNWIGDDKAFYTLPVRVSVNAMYERLCHIFGEDKIGLMHSFAKFDILDKAESMSNDEEEIVPYLDMIEASRQFAMPLSVCTADQLFTSVFKYHGFEKIYATLMYSKVVIDEPQSYSPTTLAYIVKAIKELSGLGTKFLVMSATMHPVVKRELQSFDFVQELSKDKKHYIKLEDKSIDELIDDIIKSCNNGKKVLVITNTVKKAQEVYRLLKERIDNVKLLHSLFIRKDRRVKENQIISDYKGNKPVIWISTQLVEASLDIDYDILFTELASIDSLIQRMGRVLRHRSIIPNEPNIIITLNNPSGKESVYHKDILDLTEEHIKDFNEKILLEEDKQTLMDNVYDENKAKKFYEEFNNNLRILEYGFVADNKEEAQKLFREIYNIDAIPISVYNNENIDKLIDEIKSSKKNKLNLLKKLYDYTLSIQYYRAKDKISKTDKKDVFVLDLSYNIDYGINLIDDNTELSNFI